MNTCSKKSTFEVKDMLDILLRTRVCTLPWPTNLSLSEGKPYKRLKRALSAASKKWTFLIDDGGGMFDCSPEGVRMEGEGLQSSRRFAVAYLFEHVHGKPPESEWQGRGGVLGKVMRRLDIPQTPGTVFERSSRMSLID